MAPSPRDTAVAMYDHLPSLTAVAVSAFRALADDPARPGEALDPLAHRVLPWPVGAATEALRAPARHEPLRSLLRWGLLGLSDHVVLRTLAIDHAVRDALTAGCRQLVVLGAGFDTRAGRLPALAAVPTWEVDHAATQRFKRRVPLGDHVRLVTVDFARDDLAARLVDAGFDAATPTVWIWEGVTPYLPAAATVATLDVVSALSAPDSQLLVTYATPEMSSLADRLRGGRAERLRVVGHLGFRALGEPLAGLVPTEVFHAVLANHGWSVTDDSDAPTWSRRWQPDRAPVLVIHERLAVATRRSPSA